MLSHTRGAIAYMELTFANQAKLPFAQIQNAAGEWIDPNLQEHHLTADQNGRCPLRCWELSSSFIVS